MLAKACNISLADVTHPGSPALTYARLSWVSQNYVRAETIAAVNELLRDPRRPQPALLRHRPRRHMAELHERPVRRPARHRRPRHLRDSLVTLDGLLELQPPGAGEPTMIITDQAAYSDQIFGLYWLLGYQFSPRPSAPGLPRARR